MSRSSAIVVAGLASGTCLSGAQTFVTPVQPPVSSDALVSLPAAPTPGTSSLKVAGSSTMVALGVAGMLAAAVSTRRTTASRTMRRAKLVEAQGQTLKEWIESGGSGFKDASDFDPAMQVGVTDPMGYWDPLRLCKKGDAETFRKFRNAEIKHGRVAMMASLGAVIQHYWKFYGFDNVPSGLGALFSGPGTLGGLCLFAMCGFLEKGRWQDNPSKEPGNFGDPFDLSSWIGNEYCSSAVEMRNRELNHGRAGMFAALGIIVAELATGKDAIEQFSP